MTLGFSIRPSHAQTPSANAGVAIPLYNYPDSTWTTIIQTHIEYPNVPIGYSGHEVGLQTTLAAVALGAVFVERHITLDRAMWGSDQAASVEPQGLTRLPPAGRGPERAP